MADTTQNQQFQWTTLGGNLFGDNFTLPYGRPSVPTKKTYYKFKEDFINGVLPNTNGKPNILFKKGDVIDGTIITEKIIFNKPTKVIMAKPTVVGSRTEEANGLVSVPISSVEIFDAETDAKKQLEDAIAKEKEKSNIVNEQSFLQKHKNHLIIAVVLVAGYFAYKKFNK